MAKIAQKYLGTVVVPLVAQRQTYTNSKNDVHSTLFMRDTDKSGSALYSDYIKDN
jgi:hypothetical protein